MRQLRPPESSKDEPKSAKYEPIVLFLVNPSKHYDPRADWARYASLISQGAAAELTWNTGTRRHGIHPGMRGIIVRVGEEPRGVIATVQATSEIWVGPHWNPDAKRHETGYVDLKVRALAEVDDPMPLELIREMAPQSRWTPRASGTFLAPDAANAFRFFEENAPIIVRKERIG